MIIKDAIEQLQDLKCHCSDMARGEASGNEWMKDVEALDFAIATLKQEPKSEWILLRWEIEGISCDIPWELDGKWLLFTNGKSVSIERIKKDAQDHFFPEGKIFELEDATAWMPLPEPYESEEK